MREGAAAVRSGQYKAVVEKQRALVEDGVVHASLELAWIVLGMMFPTIWLGGCS